MATNGGARIHYSAAYAEETSVKHNQAKTGQPQNILSFF
jgi:hypothetical protein